MEYSREVERIKSICLHEQRVGPSVSSIGQSKEKESGPAKFGKATNRILPVLSFRGPIKKTPTPHVFFFFFFFFLKL